MAPCWELLLAAAVKRVRSYFPGRCTAAKAKGKTSTRLLGAAIGKTGASGNMRRGNGWGRREKPQVVKGNQHLHDVIELQPRVRGGIDQDVGQGVLVVVHLICDRRGKGW